LVKAKLRYECGFEIEKDLQKKKLNFKFVKNVEKI